MEWAQEERSRSKWFQLLQLIEQGRRWGNASGLALGNGSAGADNLSLGVDPSQVLGDMNAQHLERVFPTLVAISVFLALVAAAGGVGNGLVIFAFRRHARRGATHLLILVLALIDLANCALVIPCALYLDVWMQPTYDLVCKLQCSLKSTVGLVSPMVLVLIAVDRCLQICFVPGIQIRVRTAARALLLILLVGAACSLPAGLRTGTHMQGRDGNASGRYQGQYFIPCHTDYRFIGSGAFSAFQLSQSLAFFLMLLVLVLLYSFIFFFICTHHRRWARRYPRAAASSAPAAAGPGRAGAGACSRAPKTSVSSLVAGTGAETELMSVAAGAALDEAEEEALEPVTPDEELGPGPAPGSAPALELRPLGPGAEERWSARRARSARERRKRKPHVRTAQTLAVVTLAFVVSFLPFQLIQLHLVLSGPGAESRGEKNFLFYSYFINSAVNPLIYSAMNRMFRAEIRQLCRRAAPAARRATV